MASEYHDIDKIIEQVMASIGRKRDHGQAHSTQRVYSDEPILRRGSQMPGYQPPRIRQMRELAQGREARGYSDARLFVEQGRLMADYEDDFPYHGTFQAYYPTYHYMSDQQLRGYFTWRTRVRQGICEETSTSFAYVYLYELINGIGVEPGQKALAAMGTFWQTYRTYEPGLDRYVREWLMDYAAYHGLDPSLLGPLANSEHDDAVALLARAEQAALEAVPVGTRARRPTTYGTDPQADAALTHALSLASTYRIEDSRLFKDDPDDVRRVVHAVFDRLARYYRGSRTQGLVESLFGKRQRRRHTMFGTAIFWEGERHPDCTYDLNDACRYTCEGGRWYVESYHDGGERSSKLGRILRAVDRRLRVALDYPHPLKERNDPKYLTQIIDTEIASYLAWKRQEEERLEAERLEREAHEVRIDLSKLDGIRAAAAITRESLLVDEEREEMPEVTPEEAGPAARPAEEAAAKMAPAEAVAATAAAEPLSEDAPYGLTADELAFVGDLLAGRTPLATGSADLLADSVNERLFDLLGDVAVEFDDAGQPRIIEDYEEDIRDALGL